MSDEKIEVENINVPGRIERVNRAKYEAMRPALIAVLPSDAPGITVKEALAALKPNLPQELFPAGATSGWWQKCVQLDLEAKGVIKRSDTKPLRLYLSGPKSASARRSKARTTRCIASLKKIVAVVCRMRFRNSKST